MSAKINTVRDFNDFKVIKVVKDAAEAPAEDDFGRLQPQAVDLEQAVLGALMI